MRDSKLFSGRKAIAMIELIFAIVIIGITLMSVPNLIVQAAKSGYTSLQQEAIATASSQISLILAMAWDENDNNATGDEPMTVTSGDGKLNSRPGAPWRNFDVISPLTTLPATPIGDESNDFDDIDDADGTTMQLRNFETTDPETGDLVDIHVSISTTVDYANDSPTTGDYNTASSIVYDFNPIAGTPTTNIKFISTTLTTTNPATELEKTIILRAFACNIGTYTPVGVNK